MKLAISLCTSSHAFLGGVVNQGKMWKDGLELLGHSVDLVNYWDSYKWADYDAIIVLGMGLEHVSLINEISKYNKHVISAPILDPDPSISWNMFRIKARYSLGWFKHFSGFRGMRHLFYGFEQLNAYLVRSNYEADFLTKVFKIKRKRIFIVPLSYRNKDINYFPEKEDFCFHVSRLDAPNKNVRRLIEAAKKYQFRLILAGFINGEDNKTLLLDQIRNYPNISYIGTLPDDKLNHYYEKAKVFALPSTNEGVGLVALEAAAYGAEILMTNLGGPQEYYKGMAELVNPYSIDEIGQAICKLMKEGKAQPQLMNYIKKEYSLRACSVKLEKVIISIIKTSC
ncbi:glycosyltransferase [Prevotella dentalis DSM 3688]|uniref:Glycosyltransferase n=2 Tax=Prevotella dentalis (strain ATCC 49559 / DSM 3688 / JCM 13448 / NCTC 12043 / ES 2772) TaxID=908937 RepID=L0JFY6_PREDD|nr:glycosyltransferase family 4 protein [Prevotella dentalis]AGB29482.1 glycosyltransferase [Prevotella dentalis DSM 3688]